MKLSNLLSLQEATASFRAKQLGIDNTPTPEHIENLKWIANNIYDPIKTTFPNMILEVAYRNPQVNKAVGGAKNSQHMVGEAIDIDDKNESRVENKKVFDWVVKNLNFDQIIYEFGDDTGPDWIHISCKRGNVGNRKKITKAIRVTSTVNGKQVSTTRYVPYT